MAAFGVDGPRRVPATAARGAMRYVCDAPDGNTWFQIETEAEALAESRAMDHAVERYFWEARAEAVARYEPPPGPFIERDIGLKDHVARLMPRFLTLRDREGTALVTAMLPAAANRDPRFRPIVVGRRNGDPYPAHGEAIAALARHMGLGLERDRCYPYGPPRG
jgi:hypothetical protein